MFRLFSRPTPEETVKAFQFTQILSVMPQIKQVSYRKKGKFEVIFDESIGDLEAIVNQRLFNLLAHTWMIIFGSDDAELHVGVANKGRSRLVINSSRIKFDHKFPDHDELLNRMLLLAGINRYAPIF